MARLKAALARYQAQRALAQSKARKAKHADTIREQKRAAQAARTRAAQKDRPDWLPFEDEGVYVLIGEGDFSFARSLTEILVHASIIATSLDSESEVTTKYPSTTKVPTGNKSTEKSSEQIPQQHDGAAEHITALRDSGAAVLHNIDATQLTRVRALNRLENATFVFNFPHIGNSISDQDRNIRQHQELLVAFFGQCRALNAARVIITLFDGQPYDSWQPKQLARSQQFQLVRTGRFPWGAFSHYSHQLTSKGGSTHRHQRERAARIYLWQSGKQAEGQVSKLATKSADDDSSEEDK